MDVGGGYSEGAYAVVGTKGCGAVVRGMKGTDAICPGWGAPHGAGRGAPYCCGGGPQPGSGGCRGGWKAAPHDGVGGGWNAAVVLAWGGWTQGARVVDDGVVVPLVWPVGTCPMGVGFHVEPLWEWDGVEVTDTCMLVALPP